MSSFLSDFDIFQRGRAQPPTRNTLNPMQKSYEIPTFSPPSSGGDVKDLSIIAFGATWRSILGRHGSHVVAVGMPPLEWLGKCWENYDLLVLNVGNGRVAGGCWDDY